MPNELDIKIYLLINIINTVVTPTISKTKLFLKSILGFDKKCKKI